MAYKIYDFKFEWNGNFGHARTCIEQALEQIDYPEDLKILSPDQLEQVQTQLTEQGLEFGDDDGAGDPNEANIKSLIC